MEYLHVVVTCAVAVVIYVTMDARLKVLEAARDRLIAELAAAKLRMDAESARVDSLCGELAKALVAVDGRVQRTIDDPIMGIDMEGRLVIYEGPKIVEPMGGRKMSNRWHVPPLRKTNWRQQCSTCGGKMSPRTWTYCSKKCENARKSAGEAEIDPLVLDAILDDQVAMETAGKRQAKKLKERMRVRVQEAYSESLSRKHQSNKHRPRTDLLSVAEQEFWVVVLQEQSDRYKRSGSAFVRDFIKFCTIGLEANTFYGFVVEELIESEVTIDQMKGVYESGAIKKHCKLLPRNSAAIVALLAFSDDEIDQLVKDGLVMPTSTAGEILELRDGQ